MSSDPNEAAAACGSGCGCSPSSPPRRQFLALTGMTVLAATLNALPVMAGPFEAADFAALVPPDKKLRPVWVRSLFARGGPTVYTKRRGELAYIGLPIGGLCCGTLYLGGDGKLWVWDIFNQNKEGILPRSVHWDGFGKPHDVDARNGASYVEPHLEKSPLAQGFAVKVNGVTRQLDVSGWRDVTFTGEYPLGTVTYADPKSPISVTLTAYSPFIPLNFDDSGLPATVCELTLHNLSTHQVEAEAAGWLENAASLYSALPGSGSRVNSVRQTTHATIVESRFDRSAPVPETAGRPDIVVDDFERETYAPWTTTGTAFGKGPILKTDIPAYQGDVGGAGKRVVSSHASSPGTDSDSRDKATGTLTSPPFTIARNYLSFLIGGGSNMDEVGLRLIVDGQTACQAAGHNANPMQRAAWYVGDLDGKTATLEAYDHGTGAWGNIAVDDVVQTDTVHAAPPSESDQDYGTLALALLGYGIGKADAAPESVFDVPASGEVRKAVGGPLIGAITKAIPLAPGQKHTLAYIIAWHFPNSGLNVPDAKTGNYYAVKFADAGSVAAYVTQEHSRLARDTRLWHDTWYDSTLPHWFLDRTFANTSILATTTAHRFGTGRFWGWEGVGCCEGTCTHVWHYAQAVGRLFPELERIVRERVDFGVALDAGTGKIGFRGENTGPAVDGQCGRILGAYREHQMSADSAFLRRIWLRVRDAMEFLMAYDTDGDGLLEGAQDNTLDAAWYGKIPWISSLYAAALRACEEMAAEAGDDRFSRLCHQKFQQTKLAIETQLFNGEYFIQLPGKGHEGSLGVYQGCDIDQVFGQGWAWQVALGRVLNRDKTVSALKSLYKYNFAPDVGPFREKNPEGRPYALAGDAGLIMVTNPQGLPKAFGDSSAWQYGYFNECMSGFEHQAASHMIAEGLLLEGLAVTRAVHDRYHARLRNPYNEIECSDHYSRAMASYGSFITICGFEYHGPKGRIGFAPRLTPEDFRGAFTAAEGWGTFQQKIIGTMMTASVTPKWGRLAVKTIALTVPPGRTVKSVQVSVADHSLPVTHSLAQDRVTLILKNEAQLNANERLDVQLTLE